MGLGKADKIGKTRHGAVVIHDLADDAGRVQSSKPRKIDSRFRMAGTDEHAAFFGEQREHVTRRHHVAIVLGGVDGD